MLKKRGKRKIKFCPRINWCLPNIRHHNPKGAGKDFCPTSPVLIFKAILPANYFHINQKGKIFFALQEVFLAVWFEVFVLVFFSQKQSALRSSHHSPDYNSLTNIFGFVPPFWLKQRQFTMHYKPGGYTTPFPHPISQGKKKKETWLQLPLTLALTSFSWIWWPVS